MKRNEYLLVNVQTLIMNMTGLLSEELIKCVKNDDICGTLRLLVKGVDETALDADGWNLLQHACVNSKTSDTLLSALIRKGVDPLHQDSQHRTPLHRYPRKSQVPAQQVLLVVLSLLLLYMYLHFISGSV